MEYYPNLNIYIYYTNPQVNIVMNGIYTPIGVGCQ